jgi:Pvc16 N-terminal domain
MIPEVDEALRRLLASGVPKASGVEIAFDAPTRDWAARRNAPTIDAYLYDICEDVSRRERGAVGVKDEHGIVVRRRQPPRYFRLSYLVTGWTKKAEDEHRLLSAVLGCLLSVQTLPLAETGLLADLGLAVPLTVAVPPQGSRSTTDLWSALGGDLKPSLDIVVTAPFPIGPEYLAGPAVTSEVGVRAERIDEPGTAARLRTRRVGR